MADITLFQRVSNLVNRNIISLHIGQAIAVNQSDVYTKGKTSVHATTPQHMFVTVVMTRRHESTWVYPGATLLINKKHAVPLEVSDEHGKFTIFLFDEDESLARMTPVTPDHVAALIQRWKTNPASLSNYDVSAMISMGILRHTGQPCGVEVDPDHTVFIDIEDGELTYNPDHYATVDNPVTDKFCDRTPDSNLEEAGFDAGKDWLDQWQHPPATAESSLDDFEDADDPMYPWQHPDDDDDE
jgi:hypothetical protein